MYLDIQCVSKKSCKQNAAGVQKSQPKLSVVGRNFPDRTCAKLLSLYKKRPKTNSGTSLVEVGSKVHRLLLIERVPRGLSSFCNFF